MNENEMLKHTGLLDCLLKNSDIAASVLDLNSIEIESSKQEPETGSSILYPELESPKCPKAAIKPEFSFDQIAQKIDSFVNVSFTPTERMAWKLLSAIWDPLPSNPNFDLYTPAQKDQLEKALRKSRVSEWLKECVSQKVEQTIQSIYIGIEKVFHYLAGRKINLACQTCIQNRDFRLATILSQINGAGAQVSVKSRETLAHPNGIPGRGGVDLETQLNLGSQIKMWANSTRLKDCIDKEYLAVWSLLAGNVSDWDENIFKSNLGWHRTFGLYFWYSKGGSHSLSDALKEYKLSFEQFEIIEKPLGFSQTNIYDIQYYLLLLATQQPVNLEVMLYYQSHTDQQMDSRLSWFLGLLLSAKKIKLFKDTVIDENGKQKSITLDQLTNSLVIQLETLGLWKLGLFVSLFLQSHMSREYSIKRLLSTWYEIEDSSGSIYNQCGECSADFEYLTVQLGIPNIWIHEARVKSI
jgi:hypothetical protein